MSISEKNQLSAVDLVLIVILDCLVQVWICNIVELHVKTDLRNLICKK